MYVYSLHAMRNWLTNEQVYHTFQGGCSDEGDGVDDTPPEDDFIAKWYIGGCDHTRDSCPGDSSKDLVDNYMEYSAE
jgi:hypothetical protein